MRVFKVKDRHGNKYLYNDDNVFQVCWAWEKNANLANYKIKEQKTGLGSIYSLNADTDWIVGHFGKNFTSQYQRLENLFMSGGGEAAINQLSSLRNQSRRFLNIYYDKLADVNSRNAYSLTKMDRWVTGAKFVRDFGATIVVVGSAVVTVPAAGATALLAAGASVKSYAKYTDTGNVGAAGVEFVCEMGVGALALGVKAAGTALSVGEKVCVVLFAKMPAEAAKCVASGDTFGETVAATLTAGLFAGASEGVTKILKGLPVPVGFKEAISKSQVAEIVRGAAENTFEDLAKNKAKSTVAGKGNNKSINFNALKSSHINKDSKKSEEDFVRKYCIIRI